MSRDSDRRPPGRAASPRRDVGRRGRELRALLRERDRRRAVPLRGARRATGRSRRVELKEQTDQVWHVYIPGTRARASATATACTAPTSRSAAIASTRPSCSSIPTRGRSTATCAGTSAIFGYTLRPSRRRPLVRRARQRATRCRSRSWSTPTGEWAVEYARLRDPWNGTPDLRAARQGLHDPPPRGPGGRCAGPTRASPSPPVIDYLTVARRHQRRADADPPVRVRRACCRARASPTTGATTRIGFFAPDVRYASAGVLGRAGRRSSGRWCDTLPRGGHRGDPRRRLQPHRGRQPPRARPSASAASTTRATTA